MKENSFISPHIRRGKGLSVKLISLMRELEQANKKLKHSEEVRVRILENISHDLRAPLAAVRGAVDRMLTGELSPEEEKKLLTIMDKRLTSLEQLVGELYLSQKLNQPEFMPAFECMPFSVFLEEYFIQLEVSGRIEERKRSLILPKKTSAFVKIDPHLMVRVLDNLVSNAYQHTETDDRIEFLMYTTLENIVCLNVYNSGKSIPAEHIEHVFDRTFTTSSARTPDKSGSGLGLHIAQTIITKHGGTITCKNVPAGGVLFVITLPECLPRL